MSSTAAGLTNLFKTTLEDTYRHALTSSEGTEKSLQELVLPYFRQELIKLTDRILMRLHDRSTFPSNPTVYRADSGLIKKRPGVSLLEYTLEGMEDYHAKLGRYEYPDQYTLVREKDDLPKSEVKRAPPKGPFLPRVEINLKHKLLDFYLTEVLPRIYTNDEDDTDSFGETVYVDADLLELLHFPKGQAAGCDL